MIQTNTAYMSDPARAERTVRRFMNLTLREMGTYQAQNYSLSFINPSPSF